jgi:hypothetical protein
VILSGFSDLQDRDRIRFMNVQYLDKLFVQRAGQQDSSNPDFSDASMGLGLRVKGSSFLL